MGDAAAAGAAGALASSSSSKRSRSTSKSRSCRPVALQLLVDQLAEGVDPDLVDQDLDPRPRPVDPQPLLAVEDAQHRLGDLEVVAVVGLDELIEGGRDAGHDRGAAADPDLEAPDAAPFAGEEGDVVDAGDRPVLVGAGEGGLDLARHQLRGRVADEVAHVGAGVGRRVEDLVGGDARPGVAGDVAHRVAAALARGEADGGDLPQQRLHVAQRDVVDLDVLAGGDVALVERRVALDHVGEGLHLLGGDAAERQLHPHHLHVGLALAVDALLEAEADELVFGLARRRGTARPRCRSRRTRARGSGSHGRGRSRRTRDSPACRCGPCPAAPSADRRQPPRREK